MTEYKSKVKYEAPIEINIEEDFPDPGAMAVSQIENMMWSAVLKVGITVDKEELIKALRYDRGQYEKGYHDGIHDSAGELQYFKRRICEFCGIPHADGGDPDNCEIAGHGVWIVRHTTPSSNYKSCTCGICGHERIFRPEEVPKFCEECGSKMAPVIVERKEEKE